MIFEDKLIFFWASPVTSIDFNLIVCFEIVDRLCCYEAMYLILWCCQVKDHVTMCVCVEIGVSKVPLVLLLACWLVPQNEGLKMTFHKRRRRRKQEIEEERGKLSRSMSYFCSHTSCDFLIFPQLRCKALVKACHIFSKFTGKLQEKK